MKRDRHALFTTLPALVTMLACWAIASTADAALVARWGFDGDFTDSSGNGNHLSTAAGAPGFSTDRIFGTHAASFDGDDQLKNTSPTGFGFTSYTVAGWMKAPLPGSSGYHGIFWRGPAGTGSDVEFYVQKDSNDLVVAHNRSNGGTFGFAGFADPPDDEYFHLAVTYDAITTTVKTYYNLIEQSIVAQDDQLPVPLVTAGHDISVGKVDHTGLFDPNFLDGLLDELHVFDTVLTQDELANLFEFNDIDGPFVPEPSSGILLGLGLVGIAHRRRKRY